MGLVAYVGRADIRRHFRGYAGVALLLGLIAGLSLFAVAGARRTQSAYPRFLRAANASTMSVTSFGTFDPNVNTAIAALPAVVESRTFVGFQAYVLVDGRPDFAHPFEGSGTIDGRYFDQDRFRATQGRRPDPARADEVAINELTASRYGYRVGERLELGVYSTDQQDAAFFADPSPPKLTTLATIVGIGVFPDEVQQDEGDRTTRMLLTPAFSRAAIAFVTYGDQGLVLAHGDADIGGIEGRIASRVPPGGVEFRVTSVDVLHAERAVRPLSLALGVFGLLVGLAGFVLVTQGLARTLRATRDQQAALRVFGARPRAIVSAAIVGPMCAVLVGTSMAVMLAVAMSPLMPVGAVRKVEAHRGLDVDVTVLGVGAAVIVLVLLAAVVIAALVEAPERVARRGRKIGRQSQIVARAADAGLSPVMVTGLRFALESGGAESADPTRSVMLGAALATAALVGSITFGASLTNLVHRPRLFGWSGDAAISAGKGYGNIPVDRARTILDADKAVESWSGAYFGHAPLDGVETPLLGMDVGAALLPRVLRGRTIAGSDDVVLGGATAAALHKGIGDTVTLAGDGPSHTLKIVGIASFPAIGAVHAAHTALGTGALVSHELVPGYDTDITGQLHGDFGPRAIFVRFRPGTSGSAEIAHLEQTTAPLAGFAGLDVRPVQQPAEITSSSSVVNLPIVLAGVLGLAAMTSLALALGSAMRRRRRELAILKTVGFTGRQLAATVSWLATSTIAVGLVAGVPIGVVVGKLLWRVFADQLNVVDAPTVPGLALAGLVVVAIVLANGIAAVPARRARHIDVAGVLRSE